jgi:hypothetical protein
MSDQVVVAGQEEEDRRVSQTALPVTLPRIVEEDPGEEEDKEDYEDTSDEREIYRSKT